MGSGGSGIGGNGGNGGAATSGAIYTGSGGGGSGGGGGGSGGSGIVILRYATSAGGPATSVTNATYTVAGGYRVYTWQTGGAITF